MQPLHEPHHLSVCLQVLLTERHETTRRTQVHHTSLRELQRVMLMPQAAKGYGFKVKTCKRVLHFPYLCS